MYLLMGMEGIEAELSFDLKGWTLQSNLLDVLLINPITRLDILSINDKSFLIDQNVAANY